MITNWIFNLLNINIPFFCFRTDGLKTSTVYVSLGNYSIEMEEYKEKIKSSSSFITPYPIASKEVSTAFGRCFYLYTVESATIEPKFQGNYDKPLSKVTSI